jgi:hypothetical protein
MRMTLGELRNVIREEVVRARRGGLREAMGGRYLREDSAKQKALQEVQMWWNSLAWDPDETSIDTPSGRRPGLRWSSPKEVVAWNLLSQDSKGSVLKSPIPEGDSFLGDMEELILNGGGELDDLWESRRHLFNYARSGGSNFTSFVAAMDKYCDL